MLNEFEQRSLELRTRIARSRLRMDRQLRSAGRDVVRLLPLINPSATREWTQWLGLLLAGVALSRWKNPPQLLSAWRGQLWDTWLGDGLNRLTRHLTVLARHARRRRTSAQEPTDE
jgi:hypothetical protein